MPPTIQALLAARLDQLDPAERAVLERGAVDGRVFHQSAVQALANGEPQTTTAGRARAQAARPPRTPQFAGEEAYRFRHLLIRDAAYDAVPKVVRVELHERFADWLEERGADLIELDEILGHHLEQAARYKTELGHPDTALAERAAERLAAGGRRALARGDGHAAASLLERSPRVTRRSTRRPPRARPRAGVGTRPAAGGRDRRAVRPSAQPGPATDTGEALAVSSPPATGWSSRTPWTSSTRSRVPQCPCSKRRTITPASFTSGTPSARLANHRGRLGRAKHDASNVLHHARISRPADQDPLASVPLRAGSGACGRAVAQAGRAAAGARRTLVCVLSRARLLAMLDRPAEAWPLALASERATARAHRRRRRRALPRGDRHLRRRRRAAAGYLRAFCDQLEAHHRLNNLSTYAPMLGRSLCALGRYERGGAACQRRAARSVTSRT